MPAAADFISDFISELKKQAQVQKEEYENMVARQATTESQQVQEKQMAQEEQKQRDCEAHHDCGHEYSTSIKRRVFLTIEDRHSDSTVFEGTRKLKSR